MITEQVNGSLKTSNSEENEQEEKASSSPKKAVEKKDALPFASFSPAWLTRTQDEARHDRETYTFRRGENCAWCHANYGLRVCYVLGILDCHLNLQKNNMFMEEIIILNETAHFETKIAHLTFF